ncbi:MAG: general secretion pathway protein GspK [Acetobacteraceae bacterium]|nr:general secretion pathway protein GspK [Acetobacteraceae bacterium]
MTAGVPIRRWNAKPGDRGFALLIVLWTLVLITLVVTQLGATGRSEAQLTLNLRDAASTGAAADGAVYEAILHVLEPGDGHWVADNRRYVLRLPQVVATVRIEDDSGRINPNTASLDLLQALISQVGADPRTAATLAQAIVDWRFPSAETPRINAAYRSAGLGYTPPAAAFQTLEELGLVLGMTPTLLAKLQPHLTIFHEGDPDPRVADPVVAAAIHIQTGAQIVPPTDDSGGIVVTIDVEALGPRGARAARRATVHIGGRQNGTSLDHVFRVLAWD